MSGARLRGPSILLLVLSGLACSSSDEALTPPASSNDAGADSTVTPDAQTDGFDETSTVDTAPPDALPDAGEYGNPSELLIPLDGQVLLPVAMDGTTQRRMVVDTGAVRTMVDESLVRELANGVGKVTLDFGNGVVFTDYEVLAGDLSAAVNHIGTPIDGLIGQDLFEAVWFGIDYRGELGYVMGAPPSSPPPGFTEADRLQVPFEVVQGFPVVDASIQGQAVRLIADTGSGVTILTQSSVPAGLLAGGLQGYTWYTSYGSDPGIIVRVPSMDLAGHALVDDWAVVVPDDHHLAEVFDALGIQVQGFLGYPAYRDFFVSVRSMDDRYDFFPYPGADPLSATEWTRVGIELVTSDEGTLIDMVYEPSDAKGKGILVGDVLEAVDGVDSAGRSLDDIRRGLRGAEGESRQLTLLRQGGTVEVEVAIEDLLPIPK